MSASTEVNMDMDTDNNEYINGTEEEMDESPENLSDKEKQERAESKKNEGNAFYKNKQYKEALQLYSCAIDLCPQIAAYYGNRAATHIMLGGFKSALEDANQSISIDESFLKGYLRAAKCHLALGDPGAAIRGYEHVLSLEKSNTTAKAELVQAKAVQTFENETDKCFDKGDFRKALFCIDRCIDQCLACSKFKTRKAEVLALLGRYQESQELANDILRSDNMNADAIYVRGMCLYYQDNVEKAFQHFQRVLRLAPDHSKTKQIYKKAKQLSAKKAEGNAAFKSGKFEDAYKIYTDALNIDEHNKFTNSKLYCNRATACSKINKLDEAVQDCTKAVELDDTYLKAFMRRAKCYMDLEQYEEAVRDYEKIFNLDKSRENKQLLQEAKLELKKSKRKDYYKILGVSKNVNEDEIKKAYKKRALIHHPDRHSHSTEEVQKEEEKKFKELGEAYSVLSDPKKKARYDSGQDLEDFEGGGGGFGDIDPNLIFQAFFGGGGGPPGFGGHHGHRGGGGGAHGFPGGFQFHFG